MIVDLHPATALRCSFALLAMLSIGLLTGAHAAAAIACGGAFTVGTGAYQTLARSQLAPMAAATLGVAIATFIGTLAGTSLGALLPATFVWGLVTGLLPAAGPGYLWVGQQSAIALVVASSFPASGAHAFQRMSLVAAGCLLQLLSVELVRRFRDIGVERAGWAETRQEFRDAWTRLRHCVRRWTHLPQFAWRFAMMLTAAELTARLLALPNGYWIGMTVVLLLRVDLHETWRRAVARVGGTVTGAALATLACAMAGSAPLPLAALTLGFAVLALAFQQVAYGIFSTWLTAYVVCLLSYGGLAGQVVAEHRVLGTTLGAGFALVGHLHFYHARKRAQDATRQDDPEPRRVARQKPLRRRGSPPSARSPR